MLSLSKNEDLSRLRINKCIEFPTQVINDVVRSKWNLINDSSLKHKLLFGVVDKVKYSISPLQDYVEGPVIQLTVPTEKNRSADFLLLMHPIDQPRKKDGGEFEGQIVDSGMHTHRGPRHLQIFISEKALVLIPTLTKPEILNLREGVDYIIRKKVFFVEKKRILGFETILSSSQIIEVSFDSNIAHSFNSIFNPCIVLSHHPDEALEMRTSINKFMKISDGSEFLISPQELLDSDISEYLRIRNQLLKDD